MRSKDGSKQQVGVDYVDEFEDSDEEGYEQYRSSIKEPNKIKEGVKNFFGKASVFGKEVQVIS